MDAVIMEGKFLSAGAVACVQNISNPVKLARMVMEKVCDVFRHIKSANCILLKNTYLYT